MARNSFAADPFSETTIGAMIAEHGGSIKTGPFGTTLKAAEYSREGVPLISVGEIGYGTITVHDKTPRVSPLITNRLPEYLLEFGDIVFGRKGAVDRSALVRREQAGWFLGSDGIRLRLPKGPNAPCDPVFIAFCLQEKQHRAWILQHATGTTMASLNQGIIERVPIPLPPLPEQRAIAGVLGALDDKIEVNRKTARVLEGIARAVFTSWFVDFDPVRYNIRQREHAALGRAGRFISTGDDITISDPSGKVIHRAGDAAQGPIAHLFPDRLVDSAIGEVPEGWRVEGLDASIKFLNGLALQKFPPKDGRSLPVIKIAQLRKGDTDGADRASADLDPEYIVHDGDVLFSWSGSLECVLWAGGPGALNQHLFKVTSATLPKWFYYLWVHHHLPDFRHIAAGKATTMGHIQRHHLTQALVTVPSDPRLMQAMDQFFAPLIDALCVRAVQNRTLAALRDALLPKLISGELRIADAEKIVGRAL